ncbi:hypothetical protein KO516_22385, partial [Citreicella sp. C3M06]|uniref:hypothetical protein n=1 Tax=Citreicella sp. C3M06 TaxID=2841564 RepID=UPI001C097B13
GSAGCRFAQAPGRPAGACAACCQERAVLDPLDNLISKLWMPDQFALTGAPMDGFLMRGSIMLAVIAR